MASAPPPTSTLPNRHPVVEKVAAARQRVIWRVRLRGTAWALCAALAIVLAMVLLDALLRQEDVGTRWFLSLLMLAAMIAAGVIWIVPAWTWNPTLMQIAQRIERFFPDLRDKISSALFFLEQDEDDAAGSSPYFRRRHVHQMADVLSYTDVSVALNRHLAQRSLVALAGMVTLLLLFLFFAPQTVSTAMARLAQPWQAISWPRVNNLVLVDPPTVVPLGGRANIQVADQNDRLPDTAELQVRYEEDAPPVSHSMRFDFASQSLVYQMDTVQRPFEFRVIGGDDHTMAWHSVDVVQPPRFSDIQVTLVPPEYTRWLPSQSPRSIIALEGTRLELRGAVDQAVTSAHVILESSGKAAKFPLEIGPDRRTFFISAESAAAPVLAASGTYWIEVALESGLVKGEGQRHPARVISDKVPVVNWVEPSQNLALTPQAVVELLADIRDDLAVQNVRLTVRSAGNEAPLLDEMLLQGASDRPFVSAPGNLAMGSGDQHTETYSLDLAKLPDLAPGMTLELTVTADDYRPQSGQSLPRMITIISEAQLEQRVNRQQREIITKLAEARRLQQDARQQTRSVEIQLEAGSKLGPAELANLQNGEQNQKSVREKLAEARDSAAAKVESLLNELAQNRQQEHEAAGILQELQEKIARVADAGLEPIEAEMAELRRGLPRRAARGEAPNDQPPADRTQQAAPEGESPQTVTPPDELSTDVPEGDSPPDTAKEPAETERREEKADEDPRASSPTEMKERLAAIGEKQEEVAGQLQEWQNELTRWDTFQRFAMDVRDLAERQQELSENVAQKQGETLGQDVERMAPETRGDLKRMAEQQAALAGELDRIQARMQEMLKNSPKSEEVVNTLRDAMDQNRDAAVSQRMREAGGQIEQNQLSDAKEAQQQVASSLENVLDTLQNRRETDKKELKKKLDETRQELQEMQQRQKELRSKAQETAAQQASPQQNAQQQQQQKRELENLAQQAQALQKEAERMARKLERLSAPQAAQKMRDAAQRLEAAAHEAQNMDAGQLQQEIEQAQKDLEEAEQELEKRQEKVEQDLAQEEAARLAQSVQQLVIRQERIRDELVRLDELQRGDETLTSAQQETLRVTSLEQGTLTGEIRAFAETIAKAEVFFLSLQLTAEVTTDLARLLDTGTLDAQALVLAEEAVERLQQLAAALEENAQDQQQEKPQDQQNQDPQEQQQQQQQQQGAQDGISQTAQLRLLKMMQEALKTRTERFGQRLAQQPDAVDRSELARLAAEQGRLSEMTMNLMPNVQEDLFDPEQLPEMLPPEAGPDDVLPQDDESDTKEPNNGE